MPGLSSSRWAAKDNRSSSVPLPSSRTLGSCCFGDVGDCASSNTNEPPVAYANQQAVRLDLAIAELARYSKIVRRMKWKLQFLDVAYRRATALGADRAEAELMFKLDFFEYYMLCERALVHLQGVYGITISRVPTSADSRPNLGTNRHVSHRYHANVLNALDREDNPLHEALGKGRVRRQLARAKDLRNRWKNADISALEADKKNALPLEDYDLVGILEAIHEGLDNAYTLASGFVCAESSIHTSASAIAGDTQHGLALMDMDPDTTEEEQWGFMLDAMDWEAV